MKAAREKTTTYPGTMIRITMDFASEIMEARRNNIFKLLKNCQPIILYPEKKKKPFKNEGKIHSQWKKKTNKIHQWQICSIKSDKVDSSN